MESASSTRHKKTIFFFVPILQKVTFLDFEEAASENTVVYLKRRQFVIKLREQIKDEKIK